MVKALTVSTISNGLFAMILIAIGVLNIFLIHPVPGIVYLLLSLVYLPPANAILDEKFAFRIPTILKIILGVVMIMFTLGVSDLGSLHGSAISPL